VTHCHICEKPFASDDTWIRDHCHLTGCFRGPLLLNYNLNYKDSFYIPIVFHNLSGYDSYFIIKEIATTFEDKIDILLPITKEKYSSFTKHVKDIIDKSDFRNCVKLQFIDSYKFLNISLDKLILFLNIEKLKITRLEFSKLAIEDFKLLTRKSIFPYIDCIEKLEKPRLLSRESFFHKQFVDRWYDIQERLRACHQYLAAVLHSNLGRIFKRSIFKNGSCYRLTFENFRNTCIKSYDPAHYYTLPGFTWVQC